MYSKVATNVRTDAYWFGEAQSRVVITCTLKNAETLLNHLKEFNIPYEYLGIVTEGNIDMEGEYWGHIREWKELYDTAIERKLGVVTPLLDEGKDYKAEVGKEAIKHKGEVKGF